jgi:SEC-C motif-containing protein
MNCYCGNAIPYSKCCEIAHHDINQALTAEQLMRSRYSAFVLANGHYLMQSHHASTRPIKEKKDLIKWAKSVEWIKLEVLETSQGKQDDTEGIVKFNAFFYENGEVNIIHEKSAFLKENNHWTYLGLSK